MALSVASGTGLNVMLSKHMKVVSSKKNCSQTLILQVVASATLLYTARSSHSWGGSWSGQSQQPATRLGPVFRSQGTPGFTSLREEGARQMRQRHAGVWRQGRNSSLENSGAEIRVEQRGGETVIEFARSGEAQGELSFLLLPFVFVTTARCSQLDPIRPSIPLLAFECVVVLPWLQGEGPPLHSARCIDQCQSIFIFKGFQWETT